MSTGYSVTELSVVVQFDAASETFSYSGDIHRGLIAVDSAQAWISFSLVTVNGKPQVPDAVFLSGLPISFSDSARASLSFRVWLPPPTREQTSLLMCDENRAAITHIPEHFEFRLHIAYDERIFTAVEPAILNRDLPLPAAM